MRLPLSLNPMSTEVKETLVNDGICLEYTIQADWDSSKQILMFPP